MIYPHSFHGVHRDDKLRYLVSYLCVFVGSGRRIKVSFNFLDIIFQIIILSSLPPVLCFLLPRASCGIWSLNQSCLETLHLNPKLTWIREFTVNEAPDFFSGINLVACVYDAVWTQASLSAKFFYETIRMRNGFEWQGQNWRKSWALFNTISRKLINKRVWKQVSGLSKAGCAGEYSLLSWPIIACIFTEI